MQTLNPSARIVDSFGISSDADPIELKRVFGLGGLEWVWRKVRLSALYVARWCYRVAQCNQCNVIRLKVPLIAVLTGWKNAVLGLFAPLTGLQASPIWSKQSFLALPAAPHQPQRQTVAIGPVCPDMASKTQTATKHPRADQMPTHHTCSDWHQNGQPIARQARRSFMADRAIASDAGRATAKHCYNATSAAPYELTAPTTLVSRKDVRSAGSGTQLRPPSAEHVV